MKRIALVMFLMLQLGDVAADDLASIYAVAVQNDPALRAARATRDATLEQQPLARSGLLPSVGLFGNAGYNKRDINATDIGAVDADWRSGSAGVQLSQPIYREDRLIALDQADDQVARAEVDYQTAEQDLIVRVTSAYFGVLSAQDTLRFTEADLKAIERQLDQAKQRFDVGLIAITDVNEAQARYDQARANVIVAQNNLDDAVESLSEITNLPAGQLAGLRDGVNFKPPQPASQDAWRDTALQNNPQIISARYDVDIARKEIKRQDAGDMPTLDLVGSYSVNGSDLFGSTDSKDGRIGVQLNWPLYTGGGVQAATRQARYRLEAAQEVLEQRSRAVQTQVRNAYRGVLANISRIQALEAAQVSAQSALEATEAGFEVGTRTLVDVLDSQRDLYLARRDLAVSRYDYILNFLSLLQAAGTLGEDNVANANLWLEQK